MHLIDQGRQNLCPAHPAQSKHESQTDVLALNWLEGHARIIGFWLERLVSENGDRGLIETLHRQSQWLQRVTEQIHQGDARPE